MARKPKILIIEDDPIIREELRTCLEGAGYEADILTDFANGARKALKAAPDLILLDVSLPGISGLVICQEIRRSSQVPIIFVTAKNTPMDELNGILRGGDDYVSKPYQLPVLLARIGAVLKRTMGAAHAGEGTADMPLKPEFNGIVLDTAAARLIKGDQTADLTKNEVKILYCLYEHPGKFVSREDIIDYLWDNEVFIDDNTLSVHVTRIRNKLKGLGVEDFIETRRGMGYRLH